MINKVKIVKQHSALLQTAIIYKDEVRVGVGYIYYDSYGKSVQSTLWNEETEQELIPDFYQVIFTGVEMLVVIPSNKQ